MTRFPSSPVGAFNEACTMADKLKLSLIEFVEKADEVPSTVYRWKTNKRTYNVGVFANLVSYFESEIKKRKTKKRKK